MDPDPSKASEGATVEDPRVRLTAHVRRARLRIVSGPSAGKKTEVRDEGLLIGSQPPADLILEDPNVSRRHAEIRRAPNGFLLADLDSTNGTYLADVRIESVYLGNGCVFRVGHTEIAYETHEEGVRFPPAPPRADPGLVALSTPMRELVAAIQRFAPTDFSVVIEGETGSGKEVVARALHRRSQRSEGPLVVVDCGALQENLVESELFGHERGAFTGAVESRAGAFEEADGGTLFLDEIAELPLGLQPKLLRALEARQVRRLGSNRLRPVNVRILAATNRDLPAEVSEHRFRSDLFFRLSEIRLRVPPLRERHDDLVALSRAVVGDIAPDVGFSPDLAEALRSRSWPGNVRELANVLRRAVVAASGAPVGPEHLSPVDLPDEAGPGTGLSVPVDPNLPMAQAREAVLAAFNRVYLDALLERHAGDVHAVAEHAGVHVNSVYRLLRQTRGGSR